MLGFLEIVNQIGANLGKGGFENISPPSDK